MDGHFSFFWKHLGSPIRQLEGFSRTEEVNYARNFSTGLREALLTDIWTYSFGLRIVWTWTVRRCNTELIQDFIFTLHCQTWRP